MVSAAQAPLFEYQNDPASNSQDEKSPDVHSDLSEEDLRELIRTELLAHLRTIGLTGDIKAAADLDDKTRIRLTHAMQRSYLLARERPLIEKHGPSLINYFADGTEIDPDKIDPVLSVVVADTEDAYLFRFATLLWSVPVSFGYGRRMRYLVRDRQNGRLIGLFSLGDPVYNLRDRDEWLGWTSEDRRQRLVNVMDAHIVGAVPPYNQLLCGKLVASLMTSSEVCQAFATKYGETTGIISGQQKRAQLALITVTSALGRSTLYNRLCLPEIVQFDRIGLTQGWGHFQVPEHVFQYMRRLLALQGHRYASGHRYGMGPNWRIRVMREALSQVGLSENLLRHGIAREIYAAPLADRWREFLRGQVPTCTVVRPSASEITEAALKRWVVPRAERRPDYKHWTRDQLWSLLYPPDQKISS